MLQPEIVAVLTLLIDNGEEAEDMVQFVRDELSAFNVIPFHVPEDAVNVAPLALNTPFTVNPAPDGNCSVVLGFAVNVTPEGTVTVPAIGHVPEGMVVL